MVVVISSCTLQCCGAGDTLSMSYFVWSRSDKFFIFDLLSLFLILAAYYYILIHMIVLLIIIEVI